MKKLILVICIILFSTIIYAKTKIPQNVKFLSADGCGNMATCLTVKDKKTNEILVIIVYKDEVYSICKTGMKDTSE